MKKFTIKWLLLSIVLSIASINTAWAWDFWGGKDYYVDNLAVNWSYVKMKYNNSDDLVTFNNVEGTSYYSVHFNNNSQGYDGVTFFNATTWVGKTAQSTYEQYDVHPNAYAVFVIKADKTNGQHQVGYFADPKQAIANTRVYFDATPISGWGNNAYLRYGFDCVAHADVMTKFPGTASLFYIDTKKSYYTKYAIANNAGWTGGKNVAQPSDQCEPNDSYRITKSLAFSETDINNGYSVTTMVPTNKSSTDHSCDWWNYNKNEGSGIPTQTVKIGASALSHGAVRVSYYNTSGSSTTTDLRAANASITVPQSAIIQVTAIPDAGYYCTGITVGGSGYTAGDDYTVTATTTIAATFDYRWSIAGGNESNPDAMGDWNINANIITNIGKKSTKDTGFVNITLPANTNFEFLIKDKEADVWYKNGNQDSDPVYYMTYTSHTNWDFGTGKKHNCGIRTAGAGTYKFAWNISDATLTVYYPTSYTVTFGYGDHGSTVTATGSVSSSIASGDYVASGENVTFTETHDTGYNLKGWYTASSGGTAVSTMSSSDNILNSIAANANVYAQYVPKTNTINLDANGGSGSPSSVTATYDSSDFSETVTSPEKSNYLFAGWYDDEDLSGNGSGTQVIDATGALIADVDGYTDEDGNWNNTTEEDIDLHAKWISMASLETTCWDKGEWMCGDVAGLAIPKPEATNWRDASNWPNSTLPTLETKVVLTENMTIDDTYAKAKEIVLNGVELTIGANKALQLAEGITKADGNAPTASDLVLASSASGNATLIYDLDNPIAATVQMYSHASKSSTPWAWQYIASPTDGNAQSNYYGCVMYKWNDGWKAVKGSDDMELFAGYCITYPAANHTYAVEGTLTSVTEKSFTVPAGKNLVIGNSWTAPIQIKQFTDADFGDYVSPTIYLFNTGTDNAEQASSGQSTSEARYAAGTYVTIPYADAGTENLPTVISSLQGFYVKSNQEVGGTNGTFSLNYSKHVVPSGGRGITNGAMHAPKRVAEEDEPVIAKIIAVGSNYDSEVLILEREDFSVGYDYGRDGENINSAGKAALIYALREDGTKDAVSAVPELDGTIIGFKAGEDSEYTFKFKYDGDETLYLNDTKEQRSTLLNEASSYDFTCDENDDEIRFVISRTPINKIVTGVGEVSEASHARKQMINGMLYIVRQGRIYSVDGALVK